MDDVSQLRLRAGTGGEDVMTLDKRTRLISLFMFQQYVAILFQTRILKLEGKTLEDLDEGGTAEPGLVRRTLAQGTAAASLCPRGPGRLAATLLEATITEDTSVMERLVLATGGVGVDPALIEGVRAFSDLIRDTLQVQDREGEGADGPLTLRLDPLAMQELSTMFAIAATHGPRAVLELMTLPEDGSDDEEKKGDEESSGDGEREGGEDDDPRVAFWEFMHEQPANMDKFLRMIDRMTQLSEYVDACSDDDIRAMVREGEAVARGPLLPEEHAIGHVVRGIQERVRNGLAAE